MSLNHTWINMKKVNENIISNTNIFIVTTSFWILHALYLVSEFDTLVRIVRKLLAWNKSTGSLLSLQLAFLIHHAPLTHHQSRAASALQTLKDVVFASLCAGGGGVQDKEGDNGNYMNKRDLFDFPQAFQTLAPYNVSAHSAISAGIVSEGLMPLKGWGMNKWEAWGDSVNTGGWVRGSSTNGWGVMGDYNLKLAPVWIRVCESGREQSEYIIHSLVFFLYCVTRIKAHFTSKDMQLK